MDLKAVKEALNLFGKTVVLKSKKKLKGNSSLAKSLDYDLKVSKNSIEMDFLMNEYGLYKDLGVQGKDPGGLPKPSKTSKGSKKYNKQQAPLSPYKFGSGTGEKGGLKKAINQWIVKKGIKGSRNSLGQFTKRKSMTFLISRSIYMSGIKPSLFFTTPFTIAFKQLPKEIGESFAKDVDDMIRFTTKNIEK
tara:strand:+ start:239 stop:811 length:573 start_codon:yes stop_codon:yes gene_type:complete